MSPNSPYENSIKGHESKSYKTLLLVVGLLLKTYYCKNERTQINILNWKKMTSCHGWTLAKASIPSKYYIIKYENSEANVFKKKLNYIFDRCVGANNRKEIKYFWKKQTIKNILKYFKIQESGKKYIFFLICWYVLRPGVHFIKLKHHFWAFKMPKYGHFKCLVFGLSTQNGEKVSLPFFSYHKLV